MWPSIISSLLFKCIVNLTTKLSLCILVMHNLRIRILRVDIIIGTLCHLLIVAIMQRGLWNILEVSLWLTNILLLPSRMIHHLLLLMLLHKRRWPTER